MDESARNNKLKGDKADKTVCMISQAKKSNFHSVRRLNAIQMSKTSTLFAPIRNARGVALSNRSAERAKEAGSKEGKPVEPE